MLGPCEMVHDGVHVSWPEHNGVVISMLDLFLKSEQFVDVTLAAEGRHLKVHRLVLCACSEYFEVNIDSREHARQLVYLISC